MLPTRTEAERELKLAEELFPGLWGDHSRNVARAAEAIARACGLDADKSYLFGLLHDIGRRTGYSNMRHTIDGYRYLLTLGWDEAAVICLTHSYPTLDVYQDIGRVDVSDDDLRWMDDFIRTRTFDDYDRLIILCDGLAFADRICVLEQRFVDTSIRYGVYPFTVPRWQATLAIKADFEARMGRSIYDVLPGVREALR